MKTIFLTQRVYENSTYKERRDALDQEWVKFLMNINILPIIIPNNLNYLKKIFNLQKIDGILLTGGNDLLNYGGQALERDKVDKYLIKQAIKMNIPLLGVCRGMQSIQDYFKIKLEKVKNNAGVRNKLIVKPNSRLYRFLKKYNNVNSYFKYASFSTMDQITCSSETEKGIVMSIEHKAHKIYGIMWHPEREKLKSKVDKSLIKYIFNV